MLEFFCGRSLGVVVEVALDQTLSLSLSVAGARSGGIEGAKERVIEASRIPRWN